MSINMNPDVAKVHAKVHATRSHFPPTDQGTLGDLYLDVLTVTTKRHDAGCLNDDLCKIHGHTSEHKS
jgi:hypothetical protein